MDFSEWYGTSTPRNSWRSRLPNRFGSAGSSPKRPKSSPLRAQMNCAAALPISRDIGPGLPTRLSECADAEHPREHSGLELEGSCVHPQIFVGRRVAFRVWTRRDCRQPDIFKRDPEWTPRCVGQLELPPSIGRFYMSVPHESFPSLLTGLAAGLFRFILLWGLPLCRGQSPCQSVQWAQSVNLEDY